MNVIVDPDHLQKLARPSQQVAAVAELIWNGLDADADTIMVSFERSDLGAIETITVTDNGAGIEFSLCQSAFGNLGGSWKARSGVTEHEGRPLHGRGGEGRFRALALGTRVVWTTVADDTVRGRLKTRIQLALHQPDRFVIDDPEPTDEPTGTTVVISGQRTPVESVTSEKAFGRLTREFALYLI